MGGGRGGEGRGRGGQGGCERRIEVFVKIQKKYFWGLGGVGWGVRVDVIEELKCLGKFTMFFFGGGGSGVGSGGGVWLVGGRVGGGGSGWM